MTSNKLPTPSTNWVPNQSNVFREENGEYLLLKKVSLRGKLYDIKIERRSDEGKTLLDASGKLILPSLKQIEAICTQILFQSVDPSQWYFEYHVNSSAKECCARSYNRIDSVFYEANDLVFKGMEKINRILSQPMYGWSENPSTIDPKKIPSEKNSSEKTIIQATDSVEEMSSKEIEGHSLPELHDHSPQDREASYEVRDIDGQISPDPNQPSKLAINTHAPSIPPGEDYSRTLKALELVGSHSGEQEGSDFSEEESSRDSSPGTHPVPGGLTPSSSFGESVSPQFDCEENDLTPDHLKNVRNRSESIANPYSSSRERGDENKVEEASELPNLRSESRQPIEVRVHSFQEIASEATERYKRGLKGPIPHCIQNCDLNNISFNGPNKRQIEDWIKFLYKDISKNQNYKDLIQKNNIDKKKEFEQWFKDFIVGELTLGTCPYAKNLADELRMMRV